MKKLCFAALSVLLISLLLTACDLTLKGKVSVKYMNGNELLHAEAIPEGSTITLPFVSHMLRPAGYSTQMWSRTPGGPVFDISTPITENTTLYAIWVPDEFGITDKRRDYATLSKFYPDKFTGETLRLPEYIHTIEYNAFRDYEGLYNDMSIELTIPGSMVFLEDHAFSDCGYITSITFEPSNSTEDYLRNIPWGSFNNCTKLQRIILPEGIETIDGFAFSECPDLEYVVIPSSIGRLENNTFSSCPNLKIIVAKNPYVYERLTENPEAYGVPETCMISMEEVEI